MREKGEREKGRERAQQKRGYGDQQLRRQTLTETGFAAVMAQEAVKKMEGFIHAESSQQAEPGKSP
jgi:hypothetical protein